MLTVGATEGLTMCARAYTRPDAPLVTAAPSYAAVATATEALGHQAIRVPIASRGSVDLDAMAARGTEGARAGLVYVCNPNNPTGVSVSGAALRDFVGHLAALSPTTVLVGEAYHEYMETPGYESMAADVLQNPRVLVNRTFSKLYGLAGLRLGYLIGHEATLRELAVLRVGLGANSAAVAAASAALADDAERVRQRRLNRDGRIAATRFFSARGRRVYPGEANYLFIEIGREVAPFRAACEAKGLLVGRPYQPATRWARLTIGTPDEMGAALGIFEDVLRAG
jgi:histidinol-phosphate aminotransferase